MCTSSSGRKPLVVRGREEGVVGAPQQHIAGRGDQKVVAEKAGAGGEANAGQ